MDTYTTMENALKTMTADASHQIKLT